MSGESDEANTIPVGLFLPGDFDCPDISFKCYTKQDVLRKIDKSLDVAIYKVPLTCENMHKLLPNETKMAKQGCKNVQKERNKQRAAAKSVGKVDPFRKGAGTHGLKPPRPDAKYKKIFDQIADTCGFMDKYERLYVEYYLELNGPACLVPNSGDGDCMFIAMKSQLSWNTTLEEENFTALQFRYNVVAALIEEFTDNDDFFMNACTELCGLYGCGDEDTPGPFSINSYCKYMLEETSFGDQICLKAFSYSTGCRITVLQTKFLTEQRFRHKKELCDGDFILVHNGEDHFVGAKRTSEETRGVKCDELVYSTRWTALQKEKKKAAQDLKKQQTAVKKGKMIQLSVKEWQKLKKSSDTLEEVKKAIAGGKAGSGSAKASTSVQVPGLQDPEEGATQCHVCNDGKNWNTYRQLLNHFNRWHKGATDYKCDHKGCGKIFASLKNLRIHKRVHIDQGDLEPGEQFPCPYEECVGLVYRSAQALNRHHKEKHPLPGDDPRLGTFKCPYCPKECNLERYLAEHVKVCKENPNKIVLKCLFCTKKFYIRKSLNKHMRDQHDWSK